MNRSEEDRRIRLLVREHWIVEEALTVLRATVRRSLRHRAGLTLIRSIAGELRTALRLKYELERQLAESHCTVPFVHAL